MDIDYIESGLNPQGLFEMSLERPSALTLNIQTKSRMQLDALKTYHREHINPSTSMTLVIELLIAKEFRKLKLVLMDE